MTSTRTFVLVLAAGAAAVAGLLGCPRAAHDTAQGTLLSDVRTRLSERDNKLASYSFRGATQQGTNEAAYEFAYRQPNRMRGVLISPEERTFSFDGERLFELIPAEKRFVSYANKLPKEKSALFLSRTFGPFVPEGFRAPLIPREGAVAEAVKHPKATEAVEVKVKAQDELGTMVLVAYTLRLPTMDFLGKRTEAGGQTSEIRVEDERCDEKLKLCVPTKLTQWTNGKLEATTQLENLELNPALPTQTFTLVPPEGFTQKSQELVEAN